MPPPKGPSALAQIPSDTPARALTPASPPLSALAPAYDIFTALPLPSAPPSLPAPPPPPHALFPPLYRASSVLTSKTALPPSFPPPSETARYPLFAPDDHSGVLPPAMRVLAAVAARTVGVGVEDVMLALGEFERRLVRKEKERRANERRAARARGDEGEGLDG